MAKQRTPNVLPSIKAGNELMKTVRIYFKRTLEINQKIPVILLTIKKAGVLTYPDLILCSPVGSGLEDSSL